MNNYRSTWPSALLESSLSDDSGFLEKVKGWEGEVRDPRTGLHQSYDDADSQRVSSAGEVQGTLTIGWGTTRSDWPDLKPGSRISDGKALEFLKKGIRTREQQARDWIPRFDNYPKYVREAILNAMYRGDLGPKTRGLINAGKWSQVSKEYLNHSNYINPGRYGGVRDRMKGNADAFDRYAKEVIKTVKGTGESYYAGRGLWPRKENGYVNVRSFPGVNNGWINNLLTDVQYPNKIGTVLSETRGEDGKTWIEVKLEPGTSYWSSTGWVRSDVVSTSSKGT